MSNKRKAKPDGAVYNQPAQTVHGGQTNVAGDLHVHLDRVWLGQRMRTLRDQGEAVPPQRAGEASAVPANRDAGGRWDKPAPRPSTRRQKYLRMILGRQPWNPVFVQKD